MCNLAIFIAMQNRTPLQYFIVTLKGLAMGAADVVPGVSGGTIAFISGIYEELIETIHKLDLSFFKVWKKESFKTAWKKYNLGFLFALFLGVAISLLSLAKFITWALKAEPILVWSYFFGLILASILLIGKQIKNWKISTFIYLILATLFSYTITILEPVGSPESIWFLFFAGCIAIIAMILPGLSGAFILLLLGAYYPVISTLSDLNEGLTSFNIELLTAAGSKLLVFALGAIVGLKAFSRVLNWMFKNHETKILAVLTGFMVGALNKIWPWKKVIQYRENSHGEKVPFIENSISPFDYASDPKITYAILFIVVGFLSIYLLEKLASFKKHS